MALIINFDSSFPFIKRQLVTLGDGQAFDGDGGSVLPGQGRAFANFFIDLIGGNLLISPRKCL